MSDILSQNVVLQLNGNWMRIGFRSVQEAFTALMGGDLSSPPALALDIEYERDEDDFPCYDKLVSAVPVKWLDWMTLPIRAGDRCINTSKLKIRIPTIIIAPNFKAMPKKTPRPTRKAILDRDGWRCRYTGVPLTNKTASLDHYVPRVKGGRDSFENLYAAHKEVNGKKGCMTAKEAGLRELAPNPVPRSIPLCETIKDIKHPDQVFF